MNNKYRVTFVDSATNAKNTEEVSATNIEEMKKNYELLGYKILDQQLIQQGDNKPDANIDQTLPPIGVNAGTARTPHPQESRHFIPHQQQLPKEEWKPFKLKGEKFRINTQTNEIQTWDWTHVEDEKEADSILGEYGVVLTKDAETGKVTDISTLLGSRTIADVFKKDWISGEE